MPGTNGPDIQTGTTGNDTLYGYEDADIFYDLRGNDHYDGGAGAGETGTDYDTLSYIFSEHGVVVDARLAVGNTKHLGSEERDTFTGMEKIVGSVHKDVIHAGATTDVDGFAGDDWIYSGSGANVLNGGSGIDTVSYLHATSGVTVSLALGSHDAFTGWARGDVLSGFENLQGSEYADFLEGDQGANTIWGGGGVDELRGLGGDDRLYGQNGDDYLFGFEDHDTLDGGLGDDRLDGGQGNDILIGGRGADVVRGGTGADRFVYKETSDSNSAYGIDIIKDFSKAQGDKIDLSAIDANAHVAGNQFFSPIFLNNVTGVAWSSDFTAGTIAVNHMWGNTYVSINTNDMLHPNGYDPAEMQIVLEGIHDLNWSDFIL